MCIAEGKHKSIKIIISLILAYIGLLGIRDLSLVIGMDNGFIGSGLLGYNIYQLPIMGLNAWLIYRFLDKSDWEKRIASVILGIILSISCVFGAYLFYPADIFQRSPEDIKPILNVIELLMVTVPVSDGILSISDSIFDFVSGKAQAKKGVFGKIDSFFDKKPAVELLAVWVLVFAALTPMFLANWPLNFIGDVQYQMINYLDGYITLHHPVIHTLLVGWTYDLGLKMGSPARGFQFYSLFQMTVFSFAAAYCIYFMRKIRTAPAIRIFALLFFLIMPYYKTGAISTLKDGISGAFFLIYAVGVAFLLVRKNTVRWNDYIIPALGGIFACLFRNNMIYAIVAAAVIALIIEKGKKERIVTIILIAVVAVGAVGGNKLLAKSVNAADTDKYRETLSVPLQCLARAMKYEEDMPTELREDFSHYVSDENLAKYSPFLADPIKNDANEKVLRDNIVNFVKLWIKVGIRYPEDYVEAIGSLVQGYFYPLETSYGAVMDIALYTVPYDKMEPLVKKDLAPWHKIFDCFYNESKYNIPLWGLLFRPTVYIWGLMFAIAWEIIRKRRQAFIVTLLPLMYFCTCLLGPAAMMRYILPLIYTVPVVVWAAFDKNITDGGKK